MDNVKKKYSCYRSLKTISYLIGFPLLLVMVFATSIQFIGEKAYGFSAFYGVLVIVAIWLVATILQIVLSKVAKNNYKTRTLFALIVTIGLVLVGAIVIDAIGAKTIKNVQDEYKNENILVEDYTYQVNWFSTITSNKESMNDKYLSNVDNFLKTYNIGFTAESYGDENTDLSAITYNKQEDAYYSPNGMYSDGFVFNIHQAIDILITYHQTQAEYKSKNKNADVELNKAINALEANSSSEWNKYKQTAEYKKAYGENGEAYKYMLTEDRLNQILGALGGALEDKVNSIQSMLDFFGKNELSSLLNNINQNLTVDDIITVINSLGLFEDDVDKDSLMGILKEFSFYQSPQTKPIYDFIEDDVLRQYGFAQYYATVHGAKVGSILIGENIGKVTMDFSGYPASHGYTLDELYQLKADLSYKSTLYPLMAARRYMYVMAVIIGVSCMLFYHFQNKERELFDEIAMGGK